MADSHIRRFAWRVLVSSESLLCELLDFRRIEGTVVEAYFSQCAVESRVLAQADA